LQSLEFETKNWFCISHDNMLTFQLEVTACEWG